VKFCQLFSNQQQSNSATLPATLPGNSIPSQPKHFYLYQSAGALRRGDQAAGASN